MNREEKKQQTRMSLLDASMALFAEQGYETTSVQQITERAGVSKGTFFNYFNSKDDLICELQGLYVLEEIDKVKDKPGPYIPKFYAILFGLAQRQLTSRSLNRAILQGTLGNRKSLDFQNVLLNGLKQSLIPIIQLAQAGGEIRTDIPAEVAAELAIQTYFGVITMWAMDRGDDQAVEQVAITFEIFFRGLAV